MNGNDTTKTFDNRRISVTLQFGTFREVLILERTDDHRVFIVNIFRRTVAALIFATNILNKLLVFTYNVYKELHFFLIKLLKSKK